MLQLLLDILHQIPFWAWILAPVVLLGLFTYWLTHHDIWSTIGVTFIYLVIALGATGFHLWVNFLDEHFIGTYDDYGIPANFSDPGWSLLISAWPLWLMPALTILFALFVLNWSLQSSIQFFRKKFTKKQEPKFIGSSKNVYHQLEIVNLRKKLASAEKDLKSVVEGDLNEAEIDQLHKVQEELAAKREKYLNLKEQYEQQEKEFQEIKSLAESLLEDHIDDDDDDDDED